MPPQLKCIIVFALLGPLIGWPVGYWQFAILNNSSDLAFTELAKIFVATGAFGIFAAYAFGFTPASLVGLVHWRLRRRLSAGLATLATTVIAAVAATLLGGLIAGLFWGAELTILQYFPLPGAVAALVCSMITNLRIPHASGVRGTA